MKKKNGFTLLELLVVVLIIGILAAIALPQYKMAVTKAKVASILPLMRRWKDALMEYKLQHGDYNVDDASALGVNWPSDWKDDYNNACGNNIRCYNDYWYMCQGLDNGTGMSHCSHRISANDEFSIIMYQQDDEEYEDLQGMITCEPLGIESERICKALGGQLKENVEGYNSDVVYQLN